MNPFWLQISALVLLSLYLLVKQWKRIKVAQKADAARRAARGRGFEAKPILMQMKVVRHQYLELAQHHRRASEAHREFATQIGKSLRQLSFFAGHDDAHTETVTDEHPA
jgi:hypothetical protein